MANFCIRFQGGEKLSNYVDYLSDASCKEVI